MPISFDDVVDYVAGYDVRFPESVQPAAVDEIEELTALIGDDLPEVYRDFLEVMGQNTGWIDVQALDFRVQTVLDYYRRDHALPADEFLRIGSDTKDPSYNPHLQLSLVAEELNVVAFPGCRVETLFDTTAGHLKYLAGSLPQLFARPVFRKFEIFGPARHPLALQTDFGTPQLLEPLEEILCGQLGLQPVFWSNTQVRGYCSADMAVDASQFGIRSMNILLRADDLEKQTRLASELASIFSAKIYAAQST
jgi:hypothetical protein